MTAPDKHIHIDHGFPSGEWGPCVGHKGVST